MRSRAHHEEDHGHGGGGHGGSYLVSLCDLLSLLLCFFVLLLTMSSMDNKKFRENFGIFTGAFGNLAKHNEAGTSAAFIQPISPAIPELMVSEIEDVLDHTMRGELSKIAPKPEVAPEPEAYRSLFAIEPVPEGVEVRIATGLLFVPGTARFAPWARSLLREVAEDVREHTAGLRIESYVAPVGGDRDAAWALSLPRAAAVADVVGAVPKIDTTRLSVMGYGRAAPKPLAGAAGSSLVRILFIAPERAPATTEEE